VNRTVRMKEDSSRTKDSRFEQILLRYSKNIRSTSARYSTGTSDDDDDPDP
jgi:hypothetical protein